MEILTLPQMIKNMSGEFGESVAMKYKITDVWHSITYATMSQRIQSIANALYGFGIRKGDRVGIYSQNRPEWALTDFAIQALGAISVPIYATNTSAQVEYIINDGGLSLLFCGDKNQYENVNLIKENCSSLNKVVVFDDLKDIKENDSTLELFERKGDSAQYKNEIIELSKSLQKNDVATIIYTSGTTGNPKGVMLTHGNFFHQFKAFSAHFDIDSTDRSLCFLPLSHVYERLWSYVVFKYGAVNHYLSDPKEILAYLKDVRPTAMVSVPRLYEKIYAAIQDKVENASKVKKALFSWALNTGRRFAEKKIEKRYINPFLRLNHKLADKLVLRNIREVVGGKKKFFSAGGAPLSKEIEVFFFSVGLLICQGYGLTESSPMISFNTPGDFKFGTVGKAVPACEIKIADNGEILARGENIMKGYYNNPEATNETIVDGWLKTGDVGVIDESGYLHITDRIKDLIITSGGKNIAPQRIESMVGKDFYIDQIVAVGDKQKYIAALIVPNFEALEQFAKNEDIDFSNNLELISNYKVLELFRERINKQSVELARYEEIKRFTLIEKAFTQENNEITPSLKIKRNVIVKKYADIIEKMYT